MCGSQCVNGDPYLPPSSYVRVCVLPCSESCRCLFRSRRARLRDPLDLNEAFSLQMAHSALRQKTLRVDVCRSGRGGREDCVVRKERTVPPDRPACVG